MTETEFRINHSKIIEAYQLIEMQLKVLCAAVSSDEDKYWGDRLDDHESDPLGKLIQTIQDIQLKQKKTLFSSEDFRELDGIRESRNYWAHQCFGGHSPIVFKNGSVKKTVYANRILADLEKAETWNDRIAEILRTM